MTTYVTLNLRAARVVSVALVAALLVVAALLTWEVLLPPQGEEMAPADNGAGVVAEVSETLPPLSRFRAALGRANPWQQAPVVAEVTQPAKESAVESKLDITLLGTLVGLGDQSWAIVRKGKGPEQLSLRVGDVIEDARVEGIERFLLYLRNGDRLEMITMAQDALGPASRASSGGAAVPAADRRVGVAFDLSRQRYGEMMRQGISLLKGASLSPYADGGQTLGYQVRLGERSPFREFGLESGDVVESVNQVPVTDSARMGGLFRSLAQQQEIRVNLLRDGQRRQVTINIR